jgi:hypothetical protein
VPFSDKKGQSQIKFCCATWKFAGEQNAICAVACHHRSVFGSSFLAALISSTLSRVWSRFVRFRLSEDFEPVQWGKLHV